LVRIAALCGSMLTLSGIRSRVLGRSPACDRVAAVIVVVIVIAGFGFPRQEHRRAAHHDTLAGFVPGSRQVAVVDGKIERDFLALVLAGLRLDVAPRLPAVDNDGGV